MSFLETSRSECQGSKSTRAHVCTNEYLLLRKGIGARSAGGCLEQAATDMPMNCHHRKTINSKGQDLRTDFQGTLTFGKKKSRKNLKVILHRNRRIQEIRAGRRVAAEETGGEGKSG